MRTLIVNKLKTSKLNIKLYGFNMQLTRLDKELAYLKITFLANGYLSETLSTVPTRTVNKKVNFQSSTTLRKLLVHVKQTTPERREGIQ